MPRRVINSSPAFFKRQGLSQLVNYSCIQLDSKIDVKNYTLDENLANVCVPEKLMLKIPEMESENASMTNLFDFFFFDI